TVLDVPLGVSEGVARRRAGDGQVLDLGTGTVLWLPRTSRRALAAGPDGLTYLTAPRPPPRRPRNPPRGGDEGGAFEG
ncbi:hypothetical protein JS521_36255, partial [Streptomyces sp. RHZ10]|nr:hypothetical protein [Streptomyces durocortorensis]